MKKKRKKSPIKGNTKQEDQRAERIVYAIIIVLALFGLISGYFMIKEFSSL